MRLESLVRSSSVRCLSCGHTVNNFCSLTFVDKLLCMICYKNVLAMTLATPVRHLNSLFSRSVKSKN